MLSVAADAVVKYLLCVTCTSYVNGVSMTFWSCTLISCWYAIESCWPYHYTGDIDGGGGKGGGGRGA